MIVLSALGLCWLLLSFPFCVLIGRCISFGQAGGSARQAASAPEAPVLPVQRSPAVSAGQVGEPSCP